MRLHALFLLAAIPACRGTATPPKGGQPVALAPGAQSAPPGDAAGGAATLPAVRPVLDNPVLAEAKALEMGRDYAGAARAMQKTLAGLPAGSLPLAEQCAWQYALGRLYLAGGDAADAAVAFDALSDGPAAACDVSPYAALRGAEAHLRAGHPAIAVVRARAVGQRIAHPEEAQLLLANALADAGSAAQAVPLWRDLLRREPKTWVDVACRLAAALLDGADGPPPERASEALELVTRVVVETPKIETTSGALALRARALALLPPAEAKKVADLSTAQRERRVRAWLDAGEAKKALAEADALLATLEREPRSASLCAATVAKGQAQLRAKTAAGAEVWGSAIERCEKDDLLPTALYQGAKTAASRDPALAGERYRKLEELFPKHRLADDARFQGALLALGRGDEARFSTMMLSLPDDYPEGDMRGEALFRVALLRMTHADWRGAGEVLDRIVALFPEDRHWATAGRAAYFRARVEAALGNPDAALARYARVIEEQPLTFYMTQAYARLAAADPERARQTLEAGAAEAPNAPWITRPHDELFTPGFQRGLHLLEAGDVEAAKAEIDASGVGKDGADKETLWAVALLYNLGGAPEIGHAYARSRLTDHLAHYPTGRYRTPWEIAFPRAFAPWVESESRAHGIPAALAWAVMREESDFHADAKSASNAYGLMQLIVPTARGLTAGSPFVAEETQLKRPDASIFLGTRLLGGLRGDYRYNPALAIAAYNAGGGAVARWIAARGDQDFDLWVEQIPYDETRGYIKRVLASEAAYGFLYDRDAWSEVLHIPLRAAGAAPRATDAGAAE